MIFIVVHLFLTFSLFFFHSAITEEDYDQFCLAYMFTYRDFEMGTLGLAWTGDLKNAGGVCEKNGVSLKWTVHTLTFFYDGAKKKIHFQWDQDDSATSLCGIHSILLHTNCADVSAQWKREKDAKVLLSHTSKVLCLISDFMLFFFSDKFELSLFSATFFIHFFFPLHGRMNEGQ